MAEESSNEYTPLDLSMKGEATPSTSRDGTQGVSSTLGAYKTISDLYRTLQCIRRHSRKAKSLRCVTDNGSSSCQHLGSIRSSDKAVPSPICAGMEVASANFGGGAPNAPGTAGTKQRGLCGVCGNVYSRSDALQGHAEAPTDDTAHICKACDQLSVKRSKFVDHCRNRIDKKHKCKTCGKEFHWASHLAVHYRTHTDERPYKCETCGKQFHRADHLAVHYCTHTDERPYKCETCGKQFNRAHHLDDHRRTHTNERPHKCQICNKSFRRSTHLDGHNRTHTGERPYKCQVCHKSFRQSNHLDAHYRTHTDERPYKCKICDQSFRQSHHLNIHKRTHTGERP
ncbi:uncharacterized protein LOC142589515 [Dermacentor variabilis]|uniref:uncharacterized protein LOC142589515 n=1 Tax=Dermacentor variabilis TaxID=34621 RepID=UPI003F5C74E6